MADARLYFEGFLSDFEVFPLDVMNNGVSSTHIFDFVNDFFHTVGSTSFKEAIDNGYVVLTDIDTGQNYTHAVTVVGYTNGSRLIYMDPEDGELHTCSESNARVTTAVSIKQRK